MGSFVMQLRRVATLEVVPARTARRVLVVCVFAALTALGAHAAVPVTPVPVTLQTGVVILAGALLGPWLGAASQIVYLAAGLTGLPVFAAGAGPAYLLGPTGGYLLAFPAAAWLVGMLSGRPPGASASRAATVRAGARLAVGLLAGAALILASGAALLTVLLGDPAAAVRAGVAPFLAGDLVKVLAAFLVALRVRSRTLGLL